MPEKNINNKHTQQTYGLRSEAKEFPMMCVISFVYVCNAKCPNCPYTNSNIRDSYKDRPFMHEDTYKIIAEQCGKYNSWVRISGGGEPLLHPKAIELIEYSKSVGAKIGLITNGSLLNEQNSLRLLESNVDMIEISVDASDSETYNKVRRGLDFNNLVSNIKRLVEMRNRINTTTNIIASGINQVGVDIDNVEKFWLQYVDEFQKRKYLTWSITNPHQSADKTPYLSPEEKIPCPFIFERLNVDSKGKVMICGFDIRATTDLGNVHNQSIKEIWLGQGFQHYREMHLEKRGAEIDLCRNCPDWKYRSWKHNYWKIIKNADKKHNSQLNIHESEGCIIDNR